MKHQGNDQTLRQKHSQGSTPEGLIGKSKASQITAALTAAKDLAAAHHARREHGVLRRAGSVQRSPILRANQRAAERLLTSVFEKSGFDFNKLEEIQAQSRAEARRILDAQQAEAVKHAAQVKAAFRSTVESRRKIVEHFGASTGAAGIVQASQVVLDTPFLIWPTSGFQTTRPLFFDDYHIEPWNSWAKFKVDSTDGLGASRSTSISFGRIRAIRPWSSTLTPGSC